MITRTYHIYVEAFRKEGKVLSFPFLKAWRTTSFKSLFEGDLIDIERTMLEDIAEKNKVDRSDLMVVSFNRV